MKAVTRESETDAAVRTLRATASTVGKGPDSDSAFR